MAAAGPRGPRCFSAARRAPMGSGAVERLWESHKWPLVSRRSLPGRWGVSWVRVVRELWAFLRGGVLIGPVRGWVLGCPQPGEAAMRPIKENAAYDPEQT